MNSKKNTKLKDPDHNTVVLPKEFTYEYKTENKYTMPHIKHKNNHYELICSNGFIKIYTFPGRLY